ncbi:hypothetical protein [Candidatus Nitrosotenuis uzonensis]|uniref:Uncharacterized protein n=1 Tax=Candidatus Nitrosotenuis uzonensis TaxID=1407055 RepID=V6AV24_9ARCH|nr:hypothetical protein [Candidatus Nitrosotenuis uzonensis]CDI06377.1 hypothetical protein NITUZ_40543 [Candidatus Nitrosotenuis uzonensis]
MSMHNRAVCVFCANPRPIYAAKVQWLKHLASHREAMIAYVVDNFEKCPLGAYPRHIRDKTEYAGHIRWAHTKKELIEWAYRNLIESQMATYP